jgi:hypothetical protein
MKKAMFNRHLQILTQTTHPCAAAYDYARIRRLVRLEAGLYRLPVADHQRPGLAARVISRRTASAVDVMAALRGALRCAGF